MIPNREFVEESKRNWEEFRSELDARLSRLPTLAELEKEYEAQCKRSRTCPECGFVCSTQHHMEYRHRDSSVCKKRQFEQRGIVFVPEGRNRVVCECGVGVFQCNLQKHLGGDFHKNKLMLKTG